MNRYGDFKTDFLQSAYSIGKLCVHPEYAYQESYSELLFAGIVLPCLTYLFFALNLGIERMSFLVSSTGLKTMLLVFFGLIVGFVTTVVLSGTAFLMGRVVNKNINGIRFVGCIEYSFGIALIIELVGLIIRLITGANTTSSFGILGIFVALVFVFRCFFSLDEVPKHISAGFAAIGGLITMLGLNILFFASL